MAMVELAARQQRPHLRDRGRSAWPRSPQAQHLSARLSRATLRPAAARGAGRLGAGARRRLPAGARPATITIADIVQAVDEPIQATRCEEGGPGCLAGQRCLTHDLWAELGDQIRLFLDGVTLADVIPGQVVGRATAPRRRRGGATAPARRGSRPPGA